MRSRTFLAALTLSALPFGGSYAAGGITQPFVVSACGTLPTVPHVGDTDQLYIDTSGKLCIGATFSGSVTATSAADVHATLPSPVGNAQPLNQSSSGGLYEQPIFGSTIVGLTTGLPVQPQTGSTFPVSAAALPLPSGASTSALQSTINTTLGTLFPANGALGTSSAIIGTVRDSYGSGTLVDLTHGLPVQLQTGTTLPVTPATGSFTDRSGSITAGGTSQTLAPVNASRKRIIIQNPCSTSSQGIGAIENLFINFTSAASQTGGSLELLPCGFYDPSLGPVTPELITVVAATTGHLFTAKEQ